MPSLRAADRDPPAVRHAGDLAALAVYLGLGRLKRRRPGPVARLTRALVVRQQIQRAFRRREEKAERRRLIVYGAVGAIAGLALTRASARRRPNPDAPDRASRRSRSMSA